MDLTDPAKTSASPEARTSRPWGDWPALQIVQATLVVAAVALGFWLLIREQQVVFSLFAGIVIDTAIGPGVEWLRSRGVPRGVGVVIIYAGLLALLAVMVLAVVPLVAEQSANIGQTFGQLWLDAVRALRISPSRLIRRLAWELPGSVPLTPDTAPVPEGAPAAETLDAVARLLAAVGLAANGVLVGIAVLLLAFYWTLDRERIVRGLLLLFPQHQRDGARALWEEAEVKIGGYVRGVAILSLLVGGLALAAYLLLGVPYALLLGLAAGLFEAIPVVGPALGAGVAALVTVAYAPEKTIWVLAAFGVIQFLENAVLVPRVMGREVGVSPVVTLLALLAFGTLFGLAGAILAIPLAAVIQLLLDRFVLGPAAVDNTPEGRDRLSLVRYEARELAQDVRKLLREKEVDLDDEADRLEDQLEALAADLDSLLARGDAEEEKAEAA
jgi:predicted PurR-regulated permease PerM